MRERFLYFIYKNSTLQESRTKTKIVLGNSSEMKNFAELYNK